MSASSPTDASLRPRSRNAQAQADLRVRRKQYIKSLEDTVSSLEACVRQLRHQNADLEQTVKQSFQPSAGPSSPLLQQDTIDKLTKENYKLHQLLADAGLAAAAASKLAKMGKDPVQPNAVHSRTESAASVMPHLRQPSPPISVTTVPLRCSSQSSHIAQGWSETHSLQTKRRRVSKAQAFASEAELQLGLSSNVEGVVGLQERQKLPYLSTSFNSSHPLAVSCSRSSLSPLAFPEQSCMGVSAVYRSTSTDSTYQVDTDLSILQASPNSTSSFSTSLPSAACVASPADEVESNTPGTAYSTSTSVAPISVKCPSTPPNLDFPLSLPPPSFRLDSTFSKSRTNRHQQPSPFLQQATRRPSTDFTNPSILDESSLGLFPHASRHPNSAPTPSGPPLQFTEAFASYAWNLWLSQLDQGHRPGLVSQPPKPSDSNSLPLMASTFAPWMNASGQYQSASYP